jgi:hypothetical protein
VTELVHRTARGRVWHWVRDTRLRGTVTCCSGWEVPGHLTAPPVAALMEDRCTGRGCAERWDDWVRRTIHAALVDEVERLRACA